MKRNMKGLTCAALVAAAVIAAPVAAVSLEQREIPAPAWQLGELKIPESGLAQPQRDEHTDSLLQRQMRQLEKLRRQAEREAARAEKLKQFRNTP